MSRFILLPGGRMPEAQTTLSAAYDCFVREFEPLSDLEGPIGFIYRLGFTVELDSHRIGLVLPRSSIYKVQQLAANAPGLIDPDFTGEVCFIAYGDEPYQVGERCCQFLLLPRLEMENGIRKMVAREGGLGSSGK